MDRSELLVLLYVLESSLFLTHEVDSARWAEWALFGIGDAAFFVLIHLPVVAALMYGIWALAVGRRSGLWIALVLAATGAAALFIHGYYLLTGHPEFSTKESVGLIAAMFAGALPLAWYSVSALRRPGPAA